MSRIDTGKGGDNEFVEAAELDVNEVDQAICNIHGDFVIQYFVVGGFDPMLERDELEVGHVGKESVGNLGGGAERVEVDAEVAFG